MTWVSKLFKESLAREKLTHGYPGHLTDLTGGEGRVVSKGALRAVPSQVSLRAGVPHQSLR